MKATFGPFAWRNASTKKFLGKRSQMGLFQKALEQVVLSDYRNSGFLLGNLSDLKLLWRRVDLLLC